MNNPISIALCLDRKGYTIIEVMIAVAILAIGLLGIASMQMKAIESNNLSDSITCALTLAEDKMEELLGLDYNDHELKDMVTENNADLAGIYPGRIDRQELNIDEAGNKSSGQFRRIWNIADNIPFKNNKTITVIVSWDNDGHRVSLTSIKRK